MTNKAKQKGDRFERAFAKRIGGKKVPGSGAIPGLPGDVIGPDGKIWECKARKDGFKQFYKWIDGKDALVIKADGKKWLVVMEYDRYEEEIKLRRTDENDT
jgi:hypothetical protein